MSTQKIVDVLAYAMGTVLALVIITLGFSLYQTYVDNNPPYTATNHSISAVSSNDKTLITYHKTLHVKFEAPIQLYRAVVCDGPPGFRYDFPLNMRQFDEGNLDLPRQVIVPYELPSKTRCLFTVYYTWRPFMAWKDQYVMLPDMEFIVK